MDLMIDIETLSTHNNACIYEIGLAMFDPLTGEMGPYEEIHVNVLSCLFHGGYIDPDTVAWHKRRGAQDAIMQADQVGVYIEEAMDKFIAFIKTNKTEGMCTWSRGPQFDLTILNWYLNKTNKGKDPWGYRSVRDIRTLQYVLDEAWRARYPDLEMPKRERTPATHNALEDCEEQIKDVVEAMKLLRELVSMPG